MHGVCQHDSTVTQCLTNPPGSTTDTVTQLPILIISESQDYMGHSISSDSDAIHMHVISCSMCSIVKRKLSSNITGWFHTKVNTPRFRLKHLEQHSDASDASQHSVHQIKTEISSPSVSTDATYS